MQRLPCLSALIALCFILSRCAQITPLTGGERDTTPPVLLDVQPPAGTTSFTASEVVMRFNEYVQLKDLTNQLVVSPRLTDAPVITAEGKTVRVKFIRGSLRPNTTYRLDFGRSVADMNESNSIQSLSYVFATSGALDSLTVRGSVATASTGLPAGEVVVGLYNVSDSLTKSEKDSLPFIIQPDYLARTKGDGSFSFSHLPARSFAAFAFHDLNRNLLFDSGNEKVAFTDDTVHAGADSALYLRLFTEEPARQFVKKAFSSNPGRALIIYNKPAHFSVRTLDAGIGKNIFELSKGQVKDTIVVLYREITDTLHLRIRHEALERVDTVSIALPVTRPGRRRLHQLTLSGGMQRPDPAAPVKFSFPVWMDTAGITKEKLVLRSPDDSLIGKRTWSLSWENINTLVLTGDWHRGSSYTARIDTGLVYGADGVPSDSAAIVFRIAGPEDVSKLSLNLLLRKKQPYVVQLLGGNGAVMMRRAFALALSSANRVQLVFEGLSPGTYRVKVIYDDNANGIWDTGDLAKRQQPEKVFIAAKEFKLLADWEVEEELEVKE